jgi:4-hydroxybenzoate polyprenyltransferase
MLNNIKSYLEKIHVTPVSWLVGISSVLMARFFLESFSSPSSSGFFNSDASTLIHYYLFMMSAAVVLVIFLQIFIPSWKPVISQLVAISFSAIFIAPVIDWLVSGGKGFRMLYLFDSPKEMLLSFLTFTNKSSNGGATIGLQIELALLIISSGLLVYFVSKNWKKAVVSVLVLYTIIFILSSLPGIVSIIGGGNNPAQNYFGQPLFFIQKSIENSATLSNDLHSSLGYSSDTRMFEIAFNFMMGRVLFLILIALAAIWFYLNMREKFKAMMGNFRLGRTIHFILMIFLGIFVAYTAFPFVKFNWNDILSVIVLCLSVYFSGTFAICVNDIVDEDIDRISNPDRPLITNSLSKEDMKQAALIFLVLSLIAGFLAGYTAFFFVLAFTALYYTYSAPPTRFKLIPFFSSFIIGLCSLTGVLAGFFLLSPDKHISIFPPRLALAVVVTFSLLTVTRDIKDIGGDKKAGIKTIPIIFGDAWGFRVVGFLSGLSYVLIPLFLGINILFVAAIPGALATYYFVNRKPYKENFIFITYFAFILASALLLNI